MIAEELRQSILMLHSQGRALRDISRILKVSRNTVRRVLRHREPRSRQNHPKHPAIGPQLAEVYRRCRGNGVRIQEILKDEHGIEVPYSTLTRLIREQALRTPKKRSGLYIFGPGEEMQHDTSPHRLRLGENTLPQRQNSCRL